MGDKRFCDQTGSPSTEGDRLIRKTGMSYAELKRVDFLLVERYYAVIVLKVSGAFAGKLETAA